jgi:hypothetical protein
MGPEKLGGGFGLTLTLYRLGSLGDRRESEFIKYETPPNRVAYSMVCYGLTMGQRDKVTRSLKHIVLALKPPTQKRLPEVGFI